MGDRSEQGVLEPGCWGESTGLILEEVLRFASSPRRVEGSRPQRGKGLVRGQRLTFLPTVVVHGNSPRS